MGEVAARSAVRGATMGVVISAHGDRSTGWVRLAFPFHKPTTAAIKELPGAKWGPFQGAPPGPWANKPGLHKAWFIPVHSHALLEKRLAIRTFWEPPRRAEVPAVIADRLRPYQLEGAQRLVENRGFFLTFDMRVGKTPTAIAAAAAMLGAGQADLAVVMYPAQVGDSWAAQLKSWAFVDLVRLEGRTALLQSEINDLRAQSYLFLGCHYEILAEREEDIARLISGRRVIFVADEGHAFQNRTAGRSQTAGRLTRGVPWVRKGDIPEESLPAEGVQVVAWWHLTGTPMRNKPKNLFMGFDLTIPGSMGSFSRYATRYCDAKVDDLGHFTYKGESNMEELRERLSSVSMRKTRAEVAEWLPKSERSVILCEVPERQLEHYRKLEALHAPIIRRALDDAEVGFNDRRALEQLVQATSAAKLPKAIERIQFHAERGAKLVVFGHFKESVARLAEELFEVALPDFAKGERAAPAVFDAGSYQGLSPQDRNEIIDRWRAHKGPAVLLANTLSSGIGIDLSDADVGLFLELEWVPADFRQAEDRLADVHLGKRTAAPILEYLLVPNTLDEDMALAVLGKVRSIEAVVGGDRETADLASTLRESGLVNADRLGLPSTDKETVKAALARLRDRLTGKAPASRPADLSATVAATVEAEWEDDEPPSSDSVDDDISF